MKESEEFATKYTPRVERVRTVGSREVPNRMAQDVYAFRGASNSEISAEYAAYADAQARDSFGDSIGDLPESLAQKESSARVFDSSTPEFAAAVEKIPSEVLRLLQSQFHSVPLRFVEGGIELLPDEDAPDSDSAEVDAEGEESEND